MLNSRSAAPARRQRLQNRRAIGAAPATAGVPSGTGFVVAVIARGDVVERSRREGNLVVQVRIEIANRRADHLIEQRNQARPQRSDRAGSTHHELRAIRLHQIAGLRIGMPGNVGHATTGASRICGRRHLGICLVRGKRVAESCGAVGMGTVDRILRNLRFDLSQRKVLLVFDEAQHLSIECLETLRELLDQPPHCGLLFAGTHELEEIFTRQALELEQWRSRFHAGQALPGISEEEAAAIVHSELGLGLSQRKIHKLISKSRITDLRNGGQHSYVSARRLFWVIRELQAVANAGTAGGTF
jgi:hypothetical protein